MATNEYTISKIKLPNGDICNIKDTTVTSAANHYTPSTASGQDKTASASGATAAWSIDVVKGVTINTDGKGHITGLNVTSGKIPSNPNTDTKLTVAEVTSGTTYYPIVGMGTTAATRQYDTTGFVYKGTNGTTSAVGSAQLTLGNSTASGTANNKQGKLVLYGSTAYTHTISGAPTAARTLNLPDKGGTIAVIDDIPDISGKIDTAGTGLSKSGTTLNHSNSITKQDTQAVYPIKIDAQGHISAYGTAVTLGAAAAKGVTDNSSNADVTSSDTNLITARTLYYQLAKKGYTTNTGTVTSITPGNGLINGTSGSSQTAITSSGTISIGEGKVTNAMLAGSITRNKLELNVVKTFNRTDIGTSPNYDDPGINGLFEIRKSSEVTGESGVKPFDGYGPFLSLKTPDNIAMLQISGIPSLGYYIRGKQSANVTMAGLSWQRIVTNSGTWDISISGTATNITGTVAVDHGGTGSATAAGARTNLGLGSMATEAAIDYLKLSGGTMTGPLKWANNTALPQQQSPKYFLSIDAFTDGGTTYWVNKADTKKTLLDTDTTHNNQFLRKDGTWVTPPYPVTSVAGNTGAITADTLRTSLGLSNAMHFLGVTTTNISTGTPNTTATVSISGSNVTAAAGDVVLYGSQEYVWDNSKWNLLGDESSYKVKQTAKSDPTASTTTSTTFIDTISQDANGVITATKKTLPSYVPTSTGVTAVTWDSTNKKLTRTINGTAADVVTIATIKTALGLAKADVGLGSVTNHAQVTSLQWDTTNKKLTYKVSEGTATNLLTFAAGSNISLTADTNKITIANTYSYSLPLAANGTRGGVQIGYTTDATNRNYAVQLSSEKMYVNVPWTNTTYPINGKIIDGNFSTAFRTQTKGDANSGWYISAIRNNTASVANAPQYGSGLAWGQSDTHSYLYTSYNSVEAYIGGGGSADTLNWTAKLALINSTITPGQIMISVGNAGKIATSGYTIATSVPSGAVFTDTKNTAGSTNSTSKLFLIGATTQAANPTTNSYQYTYTNNGLLSALELGLNLNGTEKAHLEWNDTDKSIDFIFD